jgi:hypothetical protein
LCQITAKAVGFPKKQLDFLKTNRSWIKNTFAPPIFAFLAINKL